MASPLHVNLVSSRELAGHVSKSANAVEVRTRVSNALGISRDHIRVVVGDRCLEDGDPVGDLRVANNVMELRTAVSKALGISDEHVKLFARDKPLDDSDPIATGDDYVKALAEPPQEFFDSEKSRDSAVVYLNQVGGGSRFFVLSPLIVLFVGLAVVMIPLCVAVYRSHASPPWAVDMLVIGSFVLIVAFLAHASFIYSVLNDDASGAAPSLLSRISFLCAAVGYFLCAIGTLGISFLDYHQATEEDDRSHIRHENRMVMLFMALSCLAYAVAMLVALRCSRTWI